MANALILERIAARRRDVERLARKLQELDAEAASVRQLHAVAAGQLEAYEDALSLISNDALAATTMAPQFVARTPRGAVEISRSLTGHWQEILAGMARRYPSPVGYAEIGDLAARAGHHVERHSIRSQMKLYKDRGYVEAVVDGQFRVTKKGADAAGAPLGKDEALPDEPESASNVTGEVSPSPEVPKQIEDLA